MDKRKQARLNRRYRKWLRKFERLNPDYTEITKSLGRRIPRTATVEEMEVYKEEVKALQMTGTIDNIPVAVERLGEIAKKNYNRAVESGRVNEMASERAFGSRENYLKALIRKGNIAGLRKKENQYKENYIQAILNSYGNSEKAKALIKKIKGMSGGLLYSIYTVPGNEDLGINNIYPGNDDIAESQLEYLIERWNEYS